MTQTISNMKTGHITMHRKCRKISKLSRKRYNLERSSQIIGILSSLEHRADNEIGKYRKV
jgi:hypothetical protein